MLVQGTNVRTVNVLKKYREKNRDCNSVIRNDGKHAQYLRLPLFIQAHSTKPVVNCPFVTSHVIMLDIFRNAQKTRFIHSFSILSDDSSKASSKTMPPHSAI